MGYMLGTCVLHSFVVEDEKEEYRRELEKAVERERLQSQELAENREVLRTALASAEQASHAKTAFLSNMSHEIRTPMNAIIGLNNIAMNDPTASKKVKEYLGRIGDSAQHLLGIINDILDMSRIESGRMIIKKEEFAFSKALEQVNSMDPREMSVLVIDNDWIALDHAEIVLAKTGISCDTAESGWEGVDKVRIRHARGG